MIKQTSFIALFFLLLACNNTNHATTNHAPVITEPCCTLLPCVFNEEMSKTREDSIRRNMNVGVLTRRLDSLFSYRVAAGFNGNVLIEKNGIIIYKKSFGIENYASRILLSENSKFQLASISKQFTAIAILKLVEDNKLGLSTSVDQFFAGFPYKNITIQSLLSHRSGLPEYMHVFSNKAKPYVVATNQDIIKWFITDKPPVASPVNSKFEYCNSNYCLLAAIVEKVSGQDFASFMRQQIFLPLGMTNSYVITTNDPLINEHKTFGYTPKWEVHGLDFFDGVVGDKGVYTTTSDMYTWSKMLRSSCLVSKETLTQMFLPRSFEKPGRKNYGYGFRLLDAQNDSTKIIYHNGWWKGYNTSFYMSPFAKYTIVVLGNKFNKTVYQAQPIIDILTGKISESIEGLEGTD